MIVLIDNGHGENTPGKCSPDKRLREYKKAREIARRLVNTLLSNGVEAHLLVPEETDVSLAERCKRANKYCDKYGAKNVLLVSIHHNAAGADGQWKSAGGWCIYTSPGQTSADLLATDLWNAAEESLKDYIGSFDAHKAKGDYDSKQKPMRADWSDKDPDYEARFYILLHTKCAAVLTENLFQDNKADVEYLLSEEGVRSIVQLYYKGITDYIKHTKA